MDPEADHAGGAAAGRAPRRRARSRRALPELAGLGVGLLHLHLLHTSAGLALNENASPDVRRDLETWLDRAVPEGAGYWRHTLEGSDDMPAHVKSVLTGPSLTLPIADGALGARHLAGGLPVRVPRPRRGAALIATLHGED